MNLNTLKTKNIMFKGISESNKKLIFGIILAAVVFLGYQVIASYMTNPVDTSLKYPNPGHYPGEIGPGTFNSSNSPDPYWNFPGKICINGDCISSWSEISAGQAIGLKAEIVGQEERPSKTEGDQLAYRSGCGDGTGNTIICDDSWHTYDLDKQPSEPYVLTRVELYRNALGWTFQDYGTGTLVYPNGTNVEGDAVGDYYRELDVDRVTIGGTYKLKIKSNGCDTSHGCSACHATVKELLNGYLPIINITSTADYLLSDINIGIFFVAADGTNNIICEWKGTETFNPGETKTYSTSIKYKQPKVFLCDDHNLEFPGLEHWGDCLPCWGYYPENYDNHGIKTCSLDEKLSTNGEYWIEVTANNFLIYKQKVKFTESGLVLI